eukprot:TRINITY_DN40869_c0_g1_i1.p1 TRINITY_DN40869_c0_g1~~TRINITY_DN40869_c0_g1_i1.p1  ORF type:complete len:403 (+),score=81.40 TRINITY_DN40869_c0_g1_i1:100-1308(+)
MEGSKPTVLIAGAGVAGLGLALFLSQSGNYRVRVFERAKEIHTYVGGHYGLNGALECLDKAGFHSLWEPLCHQLEHMLVYKRGSNFKLDLNVQDLLDGSTFHHKFGVFMRDEFQLALSKALPDGVLECGKEVVEVHDGNESVQVVFRDGSTAEGDILVGADGINSFIRRQVFGNVHKVYSGFKVWWMISDEPAPAHLQHAAAEVQSDDAITMSFTGGSSAKQVVVVGKHAPEPTSDDLKQDVSADVFDRLFREHGAYELGITDEATLRKSRLLHFAVYNMPASEAHDWFKGRVCLIGDAIHATSPFMGQGANQAMQSAYCLSRLLNEQGLENISAVFQEYYNVREPHTSRIVNNSANMGNIRIPSKGEPWLRLVKRYLFWSFARFQPAMFGKMLSHQFEIHV